MSKAEDAMEEKEIEIVRFEKYFGHVIVHWKIVHFCLRTCKENFLIHSQDFFIRGAKLTKWKLILNPKTNDRRISLTLRRLKQKPGPERVTVDFRINIMNNSTKKHGYVRLQGCEDLQMDTSLILDMHETRNVYQAIRPFDSDELYINCQLMVIDDNTIKEIHTPPEIGIQSLSEDLKHLYSEKPLCDIVLKTEGGYMGAHKAILHSRNYKFAELLNEHKKGILDLSQFKYEAVDKVLYYIYSGGVESFLKKPSIHLFDCAVFFRIRDALFHYMPYDIYLHTTIDVQTISYLWSISNFSASNEFASPILEEDLSTSWQIHVSSNIGLDGIEYVNFGAEIIDRAKSQGICVEFGVADADQNMLCLNRILKNIGGNKLTGPKFSVQRLRDEIDPYVENGTLHVAVRIRMAPGTYRNSLGKSAVSFASTCTSENPYYDLSNNILSVGESSKFSDITLIANDGTIKSHKCILLARSTFFKDKMHCMVDDELNVRVSVSMLKIMLLYMYSGQMILSDSTDYIYYPRLIVSADLLGIPSCKRSASLALQKIISISNVLPIWVYADKYNDIELKHSALKFICFNYTSVCQEETWFTLTKSHPSLIKEITWKSIKEASR